MKRVISICIVFCMVLSLLTFAPAIAAEADNGILFGDYAEEYYPRVKQGDLSGYVGSTGTSTGPHLDYRIWKNGQNIDPLKVPQEPAEPIAEKNKAAFESVRDRIIAELNGVATPDMIITDLAQLEIRSDSTDVAESVSVDKK